MSSREQEKAIEEASQWVHENGRDDSSIRSAAKRFCGDDTSEITNQIREKMRRLFGY